MFAGWPAKASGKCCFSGASDSTSGYLNPVSQQESPMNKDHYWARSIAFIPTQVEQIRRSGVAILLCRQSDAALQAGGNSSQPFGLRDTVLGLGVIWLRDQRIQSPRPKWGVT